LKILDSTQLIPPENGKNYKAFSKKRAATNLRNVRRWTPTICETNLRGDEANMNMEIFKAAQAKEIEDTKRSTVSEPRLRKVKA
jgi:hypothetical protein